jgi:DNA-binding GntR family transcriptional regulator
MGRIEVNPAARRSHVQPHDVYAHLRDLIVHGTLAPGSRLIELELAARLGVSRTPLRAALQRLRQEGYVADLPSLQRNGTERNSRLAVAPLTREDAYELFHLVGALEALAARSCARHEPAERRALAAGLEDINAAFHRAAAARRPDHDRLFELDERFHRRYVDSGAGPRLLALHSAVKPQAERYERLYVSLLATEISTSVREHARITRAIRNGQAGTAHDAVLANWRNAATRLGSVIERAGEWGRW